MPTLQDVAKRAGVSTATVSKVLSNTPYFSDATRIKVLEAVKELGYRPNLAARALSSGKTNIIAVVFPHIYDTIFKDPLVMSILEGIETVCTEQNYNILLSTPRLDQGKPDEHFRQLIESGYIEGLIAIDNVEQVSFAAEAAQLNIPTVVLGYHSGDYSVHSDDFAGGQMMMSHVLDYGHRKIGMIGVERANNIAISRRFDGMQAELEKIGLSNEVPIIISDFSTGGGADAAEQLMKNYPDITAIVCLNDRMAIGVLAQLQAIGKRVPDDISVIGYDNISLAAVSQPPLTTIDQKATDLGRVSAELLFKRLNGESPSNVVLPPQFIKRESLAARR